MAELSQSGDADRSSVQPRSEGQHSTEIALQRAAALLNEGIADALGTARLPNGARVAISDGREEIPRWLALTPSDRPKEVIGVVVGAVTSASGLDSMVVELDRPLPYRFLIGRSSGRFPQYSYREGIATYAILRLQYDHAQWLPSETVGVYLFDQAPGPDSLSDSPNPLEHVYLAEDRAVYRVLR
jgi:hypothetical protein